MKRFVFLLFIAFIACKAKPKEVDPCDKVKLPGANYKIISEIVDQSMNKSNIKIKIDKRLDEGSILQIGEFLQCSRMKYDRIWMFYYLSSQDLSDPATMPYATSHCNPWIKVEINYDI